MSHSPTIPERRWDYGMVGDDLISTPICAEDRSNALSINKHWMRGVLAGDTSYWNEKEWVRWRVEGAVNYFTVQSFRSARPDRTETKGAEEGSETTLIWRSCFSPCDGIVVTISEANITVEGPGGERVRRGCKGMRPIAAVGDIVRRNQVLACNVPPQATTGLRCSGGLTAAGIAGMLRSQHLPVRFAGVKLARVRREESLSDEIVRIAQDDDEDIYVRLEAKAYMAAVLGRPLNDLFEADLRAIDKADQLEAIIAIGEVGTESAATILADILANQTASYFLRSAAAYCLGRIDSPVARNALVQAFTAQTHRVREDALAALTDVGFGAMAELLAGVNHNDEQIQAGSAEVLRWLALRSDRATVEALIVPPVANILADEGRSLMAVWLGGQLPEPLMRAALTEVLGRDARLAYSLAVSWAFARSWIAPIQDTFQPPKQ
jgi:HEAT repeat protein